MTKRLIPAVQCALLILTFASCSGDGNDSNRHLDFVSFSYNRNMTLRDYDSIPFDSDGNSYIEISGKGILPVASDNNNTGLLRDSLMRLAAVSMDDSGKYRPVTDQEMKDAEIPDSIEPSSRLINNLQLVLLNPEVAVWESYSYSYYRGAAHGNYAYSYVNVDLKDHSMISLDNLMKPGYKEPLTQLLRNRLADRDDLLEDIDDVGIPSRFRITADGLQFIYGIYEIAPYSSGEIRVDLSGYEMASILSEYGASILIP